MRESGKKTEKKLKNNFSISLDFLRVSLKSATFPPLVDRFLIVHKIFHLGFSLLLLLMVFAGPLGMNGLQGPRGYDGKKGERGHKGDQGPMGLPGPMGFRGDSGNTGSSGKPGYPVS